MFPALAKRISESVRDLQNELPRCLRKSLKRTPTIMNSLDDLSPVSGKRQLY